MHTKTTDIPFDYLTESYQFLRQLYKLLKNLKHSLSNQILYSATEKELPQLRGELKVIDRLLGEFHSVLDIINDKQEV